MHYRKLGKTGFEISEISLGTWQVGGKWGTTFDHKLAENILSAAIESGVNFIDTADVYSNGESERAVGRIIKNSAKRIYVATKCGRRINPHVSEGYTIERLRGFVEDSLKRLGVDCLDLIQLHCPPTEVYYRPEIFSFFDKLKQEGKILNLGVSIEKVEEGLKALEYDNVTTLQVIYNMFRQRPHELLFQKAKEKNVGLIVRVPLASGLLTGKFSSNTKFDENDHRNFNRNGAAFDKGETFAGVPYENGLKAVDKLKALIPKQESLAAFALKWILLRNEVSCIIPGASSINQIQSNLQAVNFPEISEKLKQEVDKIYHEDIKHWVHQYW
jgi:aryl-alcohol dehydrogenase-like predicted oxidoreductase